MDVSLSSFFNLKISLRPCTLVITKDGLDEISKPRWWKSDNVKDSSKLKFYALLVHEELYPR